MNLKAQPLPLAANTQEAVEREMVQCIGAIVVLRGLEFSSVARTLGGSKPSRFPLLDPLGLH